MCNTLTGDEPKTGTVGEESWKLQCFINGDHYWLTSVLSFCALGEGFAGSDRKVWAGAGTVWAGEVWLADGETGPWRCAEEIEGGTEEERGWTQHRTSTQGEHISLSQFV